MAIVKYYETLGWKQNNWGNLRGLNIPWQGTVKSKNGYHAFDTPENGVRAIFVDLRTKIGVGRNTIRKIIQGVWNDKKKQYEGGYAPASDNNDVERYITVLKGYTGKSDKDVLSISDLPNMVKGIIKQEIAYDIPNTMLNAAFLASFPKTSTQSKTAKNDTLKIDLFLPLLLLALLFLTIRAIS